MLAGGPTLHAGSDLHCLAGCSRRRRPLPTRSSAQAPSTKLRTGMAKGMWVLFAAAVAAARTASAVPPAAGPTTHLGETPPTPWSARTSALRSALLLLAAQPPMQPPAPPRAAPAAPFDRTRAARTAAAALPAEVVTAPRPEDYLSASALPTDWDWRAVTVAAGAGGAHRVLARHTPAVAAPLGDAAGCSR